MREKILLATLEEFKEKGPKLTMDGISKRMSISKKTLYVYFNDKEELFTALVDYCFSDIKKSEEEIVNNQKLDIVEKIKKVMIVLPDNYEDISLTQMYVLKDKYTKAYTRLIHNIETGWEPTIQLIDEARSMGRIRKDIPNAVIKTIFESTIEAYLSKSVLKNNNITYKQGLEYLIDTIFEGVAVNERN